MGNYADYLAALRTPFVKLCRLRFLNPDGSTAFMVDNNPLNKLSSTFIASGALSMNWQNGRRRSADVTMQNVNGSYDYNVNHVWFGSEIALDMGLVLPDGSDFYIQQGVFLVESPEETVYPVNRTATLHLVDKVANLDGSLMGNLEGTYRVLAYNETQGETGEHIFSGTNIFEPIMALLSEDRGNGQPIDRVPPIFTNWYNGKTQLLPNGSTCFLTNVPYDLDVDTTKWDVILGLCEMLAAWVGYDESGALRIDPSQDDIADGDKPIAWEFSTDEAQILGATYTAQNTEVYNDYIVVGEKLSDNTMPCGRAENFDDASDTNINLIGRKTYRESGAKYFSDWQCVSKANWMLKRSAILKKSVSISCTQMFHIHGNDIVTLRRTDKPGSPVERHLVTGFSIPLAGTQAMTIDCTSVADLPFATLTSGD